VVNCPDLVSVKEKIEAARSFLTPGDFLHVDVADGVFSFHTTWNDPVGWRDLHLPFAIEAHLMVEHPLVWISPWLAAGVKRFIIHIETINGEVFDAIAELCKNAGAEFGLSSNPETPARPMQSYLGRVNFFQVLGVNPGLSGQNFLPLTLAKVKWLRENAPRAIIEVDGGMTPETAKFAKDAGADVVVSASYIFGSNDPKKAYEELKNI